MNAIIPPPRPIAIKLDGLPNNPAMEYLKKLPQWVVWQYVHKPQKRKWDKPPLDAKNGNPGSSTNPATWSTYGVAARALKNVLAHRVPLDGVGFALSADNDLTGIDLDKCRNPATGEIDPWAAEIIALAETYAEVSPSGTGIRLFARGKAQTLKCDPAHVEVYTQGRYLTVTGQHVAGIPLDIREAPLTIAALQARAARMRVDKAASDAKNPRASANRPLVDAQPGDEFSRCVNEAALRNLKAWVPALFSTDATYSSSTCGYRVTSQALGRDLEEDLSIVPDGIVDFGVHDMGDPREGRRTPIELVMEWSELEEDKTAENAGLWLCGQLGVEPVELSYGMSLVDKWGEFSDGTLGAMPMDEGPNAKDRPAEPSHDTLGDKTDLSTNAKPEPTPAPPMDVFKLLSLDDIFNMPDPTFLIDNHIPDSSLGFLYGRPGTRKSFIALDWAMHLAFGKPSWHGDKITAKAKGAVIYLTGGEGGGGMKQRARAWMSHHRVTDRKAARFHMLPVGVDFLDKEEVLKLVISLKVANLWPIALIIVDTISRAMPGADENLQKEMTQFVASCDRLKQVFNCSVLGVHHTNKEGDMRGSTVLLGAGDYVFKLERDKATDAGILTCEKMKDAEDKRSHSYRFERIVQPDGPSSLVPVREAGVVPPDPAAAAKEAKRAAAGAAAASIRQTTADDALDALDGAAEMLIPSNWERFASKLHRNGHCKSNTPSRIRNFLVGQLGNGVAVLRDGVSIVVQAVKEGSGANTSTWKIVATVTQPAAA